MLWSLGSFFFWLLLGLSLAFGFLALYHSDVRLNIFNRPQQPENPFRSFRSRPDVREAQGQFFPMAKIIRAIIIIVGGMVTLLAIAFIFASKDDSTPAETISVEPEQADEATLYTDKGNGFFSESQYDSALKYYEKVLALNPQNQSGLYNKALVFYMKKDYWGSISLVKKCLKNDPDYNEGLWLLGDAFFAVNYLDSSIAVLEKAYRNDYDDPGFLELLGDVYLKKDNRTRAAELYRKVLERDSSKFEVYRRLAELEPARAEWYRRKANEIEESLK